MEQGQCWTKRKYSLSSSLLGSSPPPPTATTTTPSYGGDSSWEEQAFAEDAVANSLGGCIWPPRSYSCSFCRREFRSAQALGGHMNVHRKDRARLKQQQQQPSSPHNEKILCHHGLETHHQLHNKPVLQSSTPFASLGGYLYSSFAPNPNSDPDFVASSPSSSSPSPSSKALLPDPSVTIDSSFREETMMIPLYESWPNLAEEDHRLYSCKFHPQADTKKLPSKGIMDSRCCRDNKNDDIDHGVMRLNSSVVYRTHPSLKFDDSTTKEPDHIISCKKRKKDASSTLVSPKSSSVDDTHDHQVKPTKMFVEFSPSSMEELDLELRLGNRSKV